MSMPKFKEVQKLNLDEIQQEILVIKRQLFDLEIQKSTRQSVKAHLFRHAHHRLAQLLMAEHKLITKPINKLSV